MKGDVVCEDWGRRDDFCSVELYYTAEFKLDEYTTFLRWVGTMDGHKIESWEVIEDNEDGPESVTERLSSQFVHTLEK